MSGKMHDPFNLATLDGGHLKEIWEKYAKGDSEADEYWIEDEVWVDQKKGFIGFRDVDDRGPVLARQEARLSRICESLERCGIPFTQSSRSQIVGAKDYQRTEMLTTTVSFTIPPDKRLEFIHEVCAVTREQVLQQCRSQAGAWYDKIVGSSAASEITSLVVADVMKRGQEWKEKYPDILVTRGFVNVGDSGVNAEIRRLIFFDFLANVSFQAQGYEGMTDPQQQWALLAAVLPETVKALESLDGVDSVRLCAASFDSEEGRARASLEIYFVPSEADCSEAPKVLKSWG